MTDSLFDPDTIPVRRPVSSDPFMRTMQRTIDAPHTLTRNGHPTTSHKAAAKVLGKTGTKRRQVFELLCQYTHGLTDEQIQDKLRMNPSTERPRRVELVDAGLVMDSGRKRRISTGMLASVWVVTAAGYAVAEQEKAA